MVAERGERDSLESVREGRGGEGGTRMMEGMNKSRRVKKVFHQRSVVEALSPSA